MKYNKFAKRGTVALALALFSLSACHRDKNTTTPALSSADDNGGYASDAARMEQTSNDVISIADVSATTGGADLRTTSTCATVTNDTTSTPHVLTINFGSVPCLCADGRTREGSIIVTYSGHYKDSGSTHTITYNNYFVNSYQVKGNKTVTNLGMNTDGNIAYSVAVLDTLVTPTDSIITWTGNRTRTWLQGYTTPDRSDDEYTITGTTTLTRANGHTFTFDITTPLTIAVECSYIEAGTVSITGSSIAVARVLNYGNTALCDDLATLTIGSYTYDIILH